VDIKGWTEAEAVHGLRLPLAPESVRP
jgi:hypothetical protein